MRVLILRGEPCARARLQVTALRSERPEIEIGLVRQGGQGGESVDREWVLDDRPARGLRRALADFSPDLIHSHGPGDLLTVCANELTAGRIPVIHDTDGAGPANDNLDLHRRAVEESPALIVASPEALERLGAQYILPPLRCVFPSYRLARELPPDERHLSIEANIDRVASFYELLAREPMAGIIPLA